ncbi:unnamed protein product, partial [Linum tenue]
AAQNQRDSSSLSETPNSHLSSTPSAFTTTIAIGISLRCAALSLFPSLNSKLRMYRHPSPLSFLPQGLYALAETVPFVLLLVLVLQQQ